MNDKFTSTGAATEPLLNAEWIPDASFLGLERWEDIDDLTPDMILDMFASADTVPISAFTALRVAERRATDQRVKDTIRAVNDAFDAHFATTERRDKVVRAVLALPLDSNLRAGVITSLADREHSDATVDAWLYVHLPEALADERLSKYPATLFYCVQSFTYADFVSTVDEVERLMDIFTLDDGTVCEDLVFAANDEELVDIALENDIFTGKD